MVMEAETPGPVPDPQKQCDSVGGVRDGEGFRPVGVFQRMAVLPNGSAVVFEVTKQFSENPPLTPEPPAEGIFVVRADGTDLRRLGDASRFGFLGSFAVQGFLPVSPDGRWLALSDLGEDRAGHEAPQIFLLDPRSGKRKQITYQSRQPTVGDAVIEFIGFLNAKTIFFYNGFPSQGTARGHLVHTDGRGVIEDLATPTVNPEGRIVADFEVTSSQPRVILVTFPAPAPNGPHVDEVVLIDGHRLLQLTNFKRYDTGFGYPSIARGRVFFTASANPPTGENPDGVCQLFSIDEFGSDLRQVTHVRSDAGPSIGCNILGVGTACGVDQPDFIPFAPDEVTGTLVFSSSCDPLGGNPFGDQLFAIRQDGKGLRQVTAARGRETLSDGTLRVEIIGPYAYPLGRSGASD